MFLSTCGYVVRPDFLTAECWAWFSLAEQAYVVLHAPRGYAAALDNISPPAVKFRHHEEDNALRQESAHQQVLIHDMEAELAQI